MCGDLFYSASRVTNPLIGSSIAMTPFEALYGSLPVPVPLGPYLDSIVPATVDMVQQHASVMHNLKEHLMKAQNRIKQFTDLKRRSVSSKLETWYS